MVPACPVYMPMKPPTFRPARAARVIDNRPSSCERGYDYRWQKLRLLVLSRDHYLCRECGKPIGVGGDVHHKIELSKGGTNDLDNLISLCHVCHSRVTARHK